MLKLKEDIRIIKTRKKLKQALLELLEYETFEKINVTKICQKASVNRVTFYSHYQDKYELFQDCVEEIKLKIIDKISMLPFSHLSSNDALLSIFQIIVTLVVDEIYENKTLIKKFQNQENSILTYIIETTSYKFLDEIQEHFSLEFKYNKQHILSFLIGGANKMIVDWIEKDKMSHVEEFKTNITSFLNELFHSSILFKGKEL